MKWGLEKLTNRDLAHSALFDDFFRIIPNEFCGEELYPKVDVHEDEKAVYVKAEMPGLDEKDLNITLADNLLTIEGEKKDEKSEGDKNRSYWYCERSFGSFTRTLTLPEGIKRDDVKATYKNGVLEIVLQKSEETQPKKITVNVN